MTIFVPLPAGGRSPRRRGTTRPALEPGGEQPGNHSKRQGYAALAVLVETLLSESLRRNWKYGAGRWVNRDS